MDVTGFISGAFSLALDLRAFILRYREIKKSRTRFINALSDEVGVLDDCIKRLHEIDERVKKILDAIEEQVTLEQLDEIMWLSADSIQLYSNMITSYIQYSVAVKQLSVNEDFMDNLRKYKGILFDYVMRVSETVHDDHSLLIGGNFYRFFKAYRDELFPKISGDEVKRLEKETQRYLDIFRRRVVPRLQSKRPRVLFKPKRLKIIYREPLKQLIEDRKKLKIDWSEENLKELIVGTFSPMSFIFDELAGIEQKLSDKNKLTYRR